MTVFCRNSPFESSTHICGNEVSFREGREEEEEEEEEEGGEEEISSCEIEGFCPTMLMFREAGV